MANQNGSAVAEKPAERVKVTLDMLFDRIEALHERLDEQGKLAQNRGNRQSQRAMTDDDARKVLGEFANEKHNDLVDKLGLSYGQIYSARLGHTFKHIHKELTDAGVRNRWLGMTP